MAHNEGGAWPRIEKLLQRSERLEIKVIGWLVEQQHVWLGGEYCQELQATTLASRQVANCGEWEIASEPKPLHQIEIFWRAGGSVWSRDDVTDSERFVERRRMLVVVANDDGLAEGD